MAIPDSSRAAAPRGRCARGGFTLIEILVVIGIVVVLVALLLPAVTAATCADLRALLTTGIRMPRSTTMIPITTRISISVNACACGSRRRLIVFSGAETDEYATTAR